MTRLIIIKTTPFMIYFFFFYKIHTIAYYVKNNTLGDAPLQENHQLQGRVMKRSYSDHSVTACCFIAFYSSYTTCNLQRIAIFFHE